jgi:hypothetical protein
MIAGTTRVMGFGNPLFVSGGANGWSLGVLEPFDSVDGAVVTPPQLEIPLDAGRRVTLIVRGIGVSGDFTFEFEARNAWRRPAVGDSVRLGTSGGVGTGVVNDFMGPKPTLTFNAPGATHVGKPLFTGKAGLTVTFHVSYERQTVPWV